MCFAFNCDSVERGVMANRKRKSTFPCLGVLYNKIFQKLPYDFILLLKQNNKQAELCMENRMPPSAKRNLEKRFHFTKRQPGLGSNN